MNHQHIVIFTALLILHLNMISERIPTFENRLILSYKKQKETENMFPCFDRVIDTDRWRFGETRNAVGTQDAGECFQNLIAFSQTFTSVSI